MKKCKDCDLIGCLRRGDEETECFYDIDLQKSKEAEEKAYWQSFLAEAAKDILCSMISNEGVADERNVDDFTKDNQVKRCCIICRQVNFKTQRKGGEE